MKKNIQEDTAGPGGEIWDYSWHEWDFVKFTLVVYPENIHIYYFYN